MCRFGSLGRGVSEGGPRVERPGYPLALYQKGSRQHETLRPSARILSLFIFILVPNGPHLLTAGFDSSNDTAGRDNRHLAMVQGDLKKAKG